MNQELNFQALPFAIGSVPGGELSSEEAEWRGRQGYAGRRSAPGVRPRPIADARRSRYPLSPRPRVGGFVPGRPWAVIPEPYPGEPVFRVGHSGSERVRWVQDCLNQAMGLQLPLTGVMGAATRSALRRFQAQNGLRPNGIAGPDTEQILAGACRTGAAPTSGAAPGSDDEPSQGEWGLEAEPEIGDVFNRMKDGLGSAVDRVLDVVGDATGSPIIDLTAKAAKSRRKGVRDPKKVHALVLHHMACCASRKAPLQNYLKVNAHFAILRDGRILQMHPISALLWVSNGFNARSVAVEFAGNFPNTQGKWWKGDTFGRDRPTRAQVEAGRHLIRYLIRTMGLTHVLAHRQAESSRVDDPGPDIWFEVGQWAVNNLGMKDGGPGFKIGTGNPIPETWRTWKSTLVAPEIGPVPQQEFPEQEIAYDAAQWEPYAGGEAGSGRRFKDRQGTCPHPDEQITHHRQCGCARCQGTRQSEWAEAEIPIFGEARETTGFEGPFSETAGLGGHPGSGRWIRRADGIVALGV